jgi:hypothetical protein
VIGKLDGQGIMVKTKDSIIFLENIQLEGASELIPNFPIGTRLGIDLFQIVMQFQKELVFLQKNSINRKRALLNENTLPYSGGGRTRPSNYRYFAANRRIYSLGCA